jgi:hypothetical protein
LRSFLSPGPDEERALIELQTLLKQRIAEAEADAGDVDARSFTVIAEAVLNPGERV